MQPDLQNYPPLSPRKRGEIRQVQPDLQNYPPLSPASGGRSDRCNPTYKTTPLYPPASGGRSDRCNPTYKTTPFIPPQAGGDQTGEKCVHNYRLYYNSYSDSPINFIAYLQPMRQPLLGQRGLKYHRDQRHHLLQFYAGYAA